MSSIHSDLFTPISSNRLSGYVKLNSVLGVIRPQLIIAPFILNGGNVIGIFTTTDFLPCSDNISNIVFDFMSPELTISLLYFLSLNGLKNPNTPCFPGLTPVIKDVHAGAEWRGIV